MKRLASFPAGISMKEKIMVLKVEEEEEVAAMGKSDQEKNESITVVTIGNDEQDADESRSEVEEKEEVAAMGKNNQEKDENITVVAIGNEAQDAEESRSEVEEKEEVAAMGKSNQEKDENISVVTIGNDEQDAEESRGEMTEDKDAITSELYNCNYCCSWYCTIKHLRVHRVNKVGVQGDDKGCKKEDRCRSKPDHSVIDVDACDEVQ